MKHVRKACVALVLAGALSMWANAEVKTEVVEYKDGDVTCKGYLAYDAAVKGPRPAVILVHEWWGQGNLVKKNAERLAALGYVGFAVDMYGDGKLTEKVEEAGKWATEMKKNPEKSKPRFLAGLEALKKRPEVDTKHIAAIGYCFGGTMVLDMARMGVELNGVASFHGGLATAVSDDHSTPKAKVLVCHGDADPFESPEEIAGFKEEMKGRKADMKFIAYPGAMHSFTNPEVDKHNLKGAKYDKAADENSWVDLQAFLKRIFAS